MLPAAHKLNWLQQAFDLTIWPGHLQEGSKALSWRSLGQLRWTAPLTLESRPLSAGSGLICTPSNLWVLADDFHHLVQVPRQGNFVGEGFRILSGELPSDAKARKRVKPDTESLIQLRSGPGGLSLLALPSGSKPNRTRGSEIHIDAADNFLGSREIDFLPLFSFLSERIPDLNIEGGVISGDTVSLFQRGNGKAGFNGIVQFGLEYLQELLHGQGLAVAASEARAMTFYAVTDADDPHIPSQLIELCVPQA